MLQFGEKIVFHYHYVALVEQLKAIIMPPNHLKSPKKCRDFNRNNSIKPELRSRARENGGRDSALRCLRPRPAGGTNCARVDRAPQVDSAPKRRGDGAARRPYQFWNSGSTFNIQLIKMRRVAENGQIEEEDENEDKKSRSILFLDCVRGCGTIET